MHNNPMLYHCSCYNKQYITWDTGEVRKPTLQCSMCSTAVDAWNDAPWALAPSWHAYKKHVHF